MERRLSKTSCTTDCHFNRLTISSIHWCGYNSGVSSGFVNRRCEVASSEGQTTRLTTVAESGFWEGKPSGKRARFRKRRWKRLFSYVLAYRAIDAIIRLGEGRACEGEQEAFGSDTRAPGGYPRGGLRRFFAGQRAQSRPHWLGRESSGLEPD